MMMMRMMRGGQKQEKKIEHLKLADLVAAVDDKTDKETELDEEVVGDPSARSSDQQTRDVCESSPHRSDLHKDEPQRRWWRRPVCGH